jgi:hypothetical protein
MGIGAAMVSADLVALASLWEAPTCLSYTIMFQTDNQKHLKLEFTMIKTKDQQHN